MATVSPGRQVACSASVTASTQPEVMIMSSGESGQPEASERLAIAVRSRLIPFGPV